MGVGVRFRETEKPMFRRKGAGKIEDKGRKKTRRRPES